MDFKSLNQLKGIQKVLDIANTPAMQQARLISNNLAEALEPLQPIFEQTRQ